MLYFIFIWFQIFFSFFSLLHLFSKYFIFISSLSHRLFRRMLVQFFQIFGTCSRVFLLLAINFTSLKSETNLNPFTIINLLLWQTLTAWSCHFPVSSSQLWERPWTSWGSSSRHCSMQTFSSSKLEIKVLASFLAHHSEVTIPHCLMPVVSYFVCLFLRYSIQEDKCSPCYLILAPSAYLLKYDF